jgi:hypothetical protein
VQRFSTWGSVSSVRAISSVKDTRYYGTTHTELSPLRISLFMIGYDVLPVVLYGCETWSLTLREERRLRVFENRMLRKVF